jgi:hypothetical protein
MQQRKQVLGAQHELAQMIAIARAWHVRALAASAALSALALAAGVARHAVRR